MPDTGGIHPRAHKPSVAALQTKFDRGVALQQQGKLADAERLYEEVLYHQPDHYDALLLLGAIAHQKQRSVQAVEFFRKAIKVNAKIADAHSNLGVALLSLKRAEEALASLDAAIALTPDWVEDYKHRGNALLMLNRYEEALASLDKAVALKPDFADAYSDRGNVLKALNRREEALTSYGTAIAWKPGCAEAWIGRGTILSAAKRFDEALVAYERASTLRPDFYETWLGLSKIYAATGRFQEAINSFDKQLRLNTPKDHKSYDNIISLGRAIFSLDCIPSIYAEESEIKETRARLVGTMQAIECELNKLSGNGPFVCPQSILEAIFCVSGFYVSYQQENDRDLARLYSRILKRILLVDDYAPTTKIKPSDKIRLGIATELPKNHPGSRYAYEWLSHLPRGDYEFYIYSFRSEVDEATSKLANLGTLKHLSFDSSSFKNSIDLMRADELHFLMLPDVGMGANSRILSQYRIAPVQFTSWGHPITTGSPNIDYFLSSELMEVPNADEHYTEKLIRLPNTSRFIERPAILSDDNATFDLPRDRVLYGCLQSLFKLLPQYDVVYSKIAKLVPSAYFVFIEGDPSHMTAILKKRLARAFEREGLNANEYIQFLPRMNTKRYANLFKEIHVNIDSIGWSGGYTTIECLEADCPVVTLPTEYMRGRHSYAMLKMMGVNELIATSLQDFIDKLSQLGADPSMRRAIVEKISQNKQKLYTDWTIIDAFDEFLKSEFAKLSS